MKKSTYSVKTHKLTEREEAFLYNTIRLFNEKSMTVAKFGKAIGYSHGYYSLLIRRRVRPSYDTTVAIAKLFGLSVEEMMDPATLPAPSKGLSEIEEDADILLSMRKDISALTVFCRKLAADLGVEFEENKP